MALTRYVAAPAISFVVILPFVQGREGARFAFGSITLPLATLLGDVTEKVVITLRIRSAAC